MVFMFCLVGLIVTGTAFGAGGQQCVDNEDGTITDNNTGLMWQKTTAGPMNWIDAMNYASRLSLAGHSDWRLPTKDELVGLYNSPCKSMMDVAPEWYWSSSPSASDSDIAWDVSFSSGGVSYGYVYHYERVRAVRYAQ
jgi:hypothetical protein